MSREANDLMLMSRVAAGDRAAFDELFRLHGSVVLGFLVRLLRRRAEAEEVLQEAMLKAWRLAARYRPERATPRGWLLTLARSSAIDRLRSATARARREESFVLEAGWDQPQEAVGTAALESSDRQRTVARALAELPEEQRDCIELAFFEGLTHSQVAARLEQPLGTVKSRILLGMKKLRSRLDPSRGSSS